MALASTISVQDVHSLLPVGVAVQGTTEKFFHGKDIGDVPSVFTVPHLKEHELAAVGTFVHREIVPGFQFRVRKNGTDKYLFDGKPQYLEGIGQGYGKRLTFQSADILSNENFFWSDSNHELGYAFSINVVSPGDLFSVFMDGAKVGVAELIDANEEQTIISSEFDSDHQKDVRVHFTCVVNGSADVEDCFPMEIQGTVRAVKLRNERRFKVRFISAVHPTTGGSIQFRPL